MMDINLNTKRILIFLAFAFGIPWAAALVVYLTVRTDDLINVVNLVNYVVIMPAPALANVAARLITKEGWGQLWLRPNFRRGWRFYLAAWLLPLLAIIVGGASFYLFFPQSFDPNLGEVRKLFAGTSLATVDNPWPLLLYIVVQAMIFSIPIGTLIAVGEEFGWRAYLLPKLVERFAGAEGASAGAQDPAHAGGLDAARARKAALLIGVIWGMWHWPWILISMTYDPSMPLLYLLVYLVSTCSLSILLSWITLRSGSVWPAALGHGLLRPYTMLVVLPLKGPAIPLLGPGFDGLIGCLGFLVLALVLYFNRRALAGEKEAGSEKEQAFVGA
jgi:membrane protease YdiL (CAAX protease family)